MKFIEGQLLFYVPTTRHNSMGYVKVSKVGRKWVYLEDGRRFDPSRFCDGRCPIDSGGYAAFGHVWFSEDEYMADGNRNAMLEKLRAGFLVGGAYRSASMEKLGQVLRFLENTDDD